MNWVVRKPIDISKQVRPILHMTHVVRFIRNFIDCGTLRAIEDSLTFTNMLWENRSTVRHGQQGGQGCQSACYSLTLNCGVPHLDNVDRPIFFEEPVKRG